MNNLQEIKNLIKKSENPKKEIMRQIDIADSEDILKMLEDLLNFEIQKDKLTKKYIENEETIDSEDNNPPESIDENLKKSERSLDIEKIERKEGAIIINKKNDDKDLLQRTAFMNFVKSRAERSSPNFGTNQIERASATSDLSAIIPKTVINQIQTKLIESSEIYSKITKTNFQGGVEFPVNSFKPVARWVSENTESIPQNPTLKDKIVFHYYMIEVPIAITTVASVVTLQAFENLISRLIVEALVEKIEEDYISGDGIGKMLGILESPTLQNKNKINVTAEDIKTFKFWVQSLRFVEKAYRKNAVFVMNEATFFNFLGLVDMSGQPIARINMGLSGKYDDYRIMGRPVVTTESLKPFEESSDKEAFMVLTDISTYCINNNADFVSVKWSDHSKHTENMNIFSILDGKLLHSWGTSVFYKSDSLSGPFTNSTKNRNRPKTDITMDSI